VLFRSVLQFADVSLDEMLRELGEDARVLASRKAIRVSVNELEPLRVRGDAVRLRQLFLNLVENAVKYTPKNGTISITLRRTDNKAIVSISDTGIGISKKDLQKVFDRFYRVKTDGSGSGLGLSIAKWIAEAHHGTLHVVSREKRGSTFTVTLPLPLQSV
jgi:two-component system OmpR family sensor kinase